MREYSLVYHTLFLKIILGRISPKAQVRLGFSHTFPCLVSMVTMNATRLHIPFLLSNFVCYCHIRLVLSILLTVQCHGKAQHRHWQTDDKVQEVKFRENKKKQWIGRSYLGMPRTVHWMPSHRSPLEFRRQKDPASREGHKRLPGEIGSIKFGVLHKICNK